MIRTNNQTQAQSLGRRFRTIAAYQLLTLGVVAAAFASTGGSLHVLTSEHGLSQSSVFSVLEASNGNLWFATEDGLTRFDGKSIAVDRHDPKDAQSLPANFLRGLAEDGKGRVWVATEGGGLYVQNLETSEATRIGAAIGPRKSRLSSDYLQTVLVTRKGTVWVGTREHGLDRVNPRNMRVKNFKHLASDSSSLADNRVYALMEDHRGRLWVGTGAGLDRFDPRNKRFVHYPYVPGDSSTLSGDRVRAIMESADGSIWVGTDGGGLSRLDPATGVFERFSQTNGTRPSLRDNRVRALHQDHQGLIWIGTRSGVDVYNPMTQVFRPVHAADHTSVLSMVQDRIGNLWLGLQMGGVALLSLRGEALPKPVERPAELPKPDDMIMAFAEDLDGHFFIGSLGGGLTQVDRSTGKVMKFRSQEGDPESLGDDRVMALLADRSGRLWVGTKSGGLSLFDPATRNFRTFRHDPNDPTSLGADGVMSLYEDSNGTLWVGTFGGGLNRFYPGSETFERFVPDENAGKRGLASGRITCMTEAGGGKMWIGTDGGGLSLFDPTSGRAKTLRHNPRSERGLPSDTVFSLYRDTRGVVWAGTLGGGLARVQLVNDEPRLTVFGEAAGLPNSTVYAIQPDAKGGLWLSTNEGLSRFDPLSTRFESFTTNDGLTEKEFNFGASYKGSDGRLYFGGISGFDAFHPQTLLDAKGGY